MGREDFFAEDAREQPRTNTEIVEASRKTRSGQEGRGEENGCPTEDKRVAEEGTSYKEHVEVRDPLQKILWKLDGV